MLLYSNSRAITRIHLSSFGSKKELHVFLHYIQATSLTDVVDLRQHLANIVTPISTSSQQDAATIQAFQRGLHASAPSLARSSMNRHIVPPTVTTASDPIQWQQYRIP